MVSAASTVKDIAQQTKTYHFAVHSPITVYLRAEHAEVRVRRWARPQVEVTARLQASFGWRVATDQDEAGVYVVAQRRAVMGSLSSATFEVLVPHDAYLVLKLTNGRLLVEDAKGTFHIAPPTLGGQSDIQHEA